MMPESEYDNVAPSYLKEIAKNVIMDLTDIQCEDLLEQWRKMHG